MTAVNPPNGHDKPKCGAKKRDASGDCCKRPAGWGTSHPGTGRCKLHGGSTRDHVKHARREEAEQAVATYGLPREIDPREALAEEVYRTTGVVDWLAKQVAALEPDDVVWGVAQEVDKMSGENPGTDTTRKAVPNVWVDLFQRERRHLREVCRDAAAAGVEERRLRLAEQYGGMLAGAVRGILRDLGLTEEQWAQVPVIVPKHLRSLSSEDDDR